ncbi:MAG: hypothetical protein LBK01_04450 [Burkholderiaceae bacterium]|jgi:hypothetical protein|nr:hypothetical protein [Burkholderiaceae bacterium]
MDASLTTTIVENIAIIKEIVVCLISIGGTIAGALWGAKIGGGKVLEATQQAHKLQQTAQEKQERDALQRVLSAIHTEAVTLWESYMRGAGKHITQLPDGEPFFMQSTLTQDYFTVYSRNISVISSMANRSVQEAVISAYTLAKSLLDTYQGNNRILAEYEKVAIVYREQIIAAHAQATAELPSPSYGSYLKGSQESLIDYATQLKKSHYETEAAVQRLLPLLQQEIEFLQNASDKQ